MGKKTVLDKDLKRIDRLRDALRNTAWRRALGLGFLFLLLVLPFVWLVAGEASPLPVVLGVAVLAGYVALSVAANDVALQIGPSVSSRALPLAAALLLAAGFEAAGALTAGQGVTSTVAFALTDTAALAEAGVIGRAAAAALLATALWINLAILVRANVSTTQAVVGGMLGVAVAALGSDGVAWPLAAAIAGGWLLAPLAAATLAALIRSAIKRGVLHQPAPTALAVRVGAAAVAAMAGGFAAFLAARVGGLAGWPALLAGLVIGAAAYLGAARLLVRQTLADGRREDALGGKPRKAAALLFRLPVLVAGALLAFGHGANDVANAVGPLAAVTAALSPAGAASALLPGGTGAPMVTWWVLLVGAAGLAVGLLLFGPHAAGGSSESGFDAVDPVRAFSVTAAAAVVVLAASALGMPVSATHTLVGAVFGVGFLSEFKRQGRMGRAAVKVVGLAPVEEAPLTPLLQAGTEPMHPADIAYDQEKRRRRRHRRLQYLGGMVAAWLITVPAVAALAAGLFWGLGLVLP